MCGERVLTEVPQSGEIDYDYVRDHYGHLYDHLLDLMDEYDPVRLGAPEGHYWPEVSTILLREVYTDIGRAVWNAWHHVPLSEG